MIGLLIMEEQIESFVKERTMTGDFRASMDDKEIWSSFERIEIALSMEEEFGFKFSSEQLAQLDSPRSFIAIATEILQRVR
jgi:acyl carrier protein